LKNSNSNILCALLLALGISTAGWLVGQGFTKGRSSDRFVTVKGISERDVSANIALWPIRFVSTDDDLKKAQSKIKSSEEQILSFLKRHGIGHNDVHIQNLEVTDLLANPYRSGPTKSRYIIAQTLMVRTDDPESIQRASQQVGELVERGVVLSSSGGPSMGPTYLFAELTRLKPEMIAEATANARRAAEQFAMDSGSKLGTIRRANQGVFVILPRDRAPGIQEGGQIQKTVRVVSTVEYYLKH
jgi:hypothetical protein